MKTPVSHAEPRSTPMVWDIPSFEDDEPDQSLELEMTGKVVFITVQGMQEAPAMAMEFIRSGANVAFLDVSEWVLHIPAFKQSAFSSGFEQTIHCPSWVTAVEEVIARFGPINLWLDTRAMTWPAVSRTGSVR